MLLASWGLLLLTTPILLALAQTYKADAKFMLVVLPAVLALVTIAANVSTWLLIALGALGQTLDVEAHPRHRRSAADPNPAHLAFQRRVPELR